VLAWVQALFPVRVIMQYAASRGPILASGLAFQAVFAVFAGLWVGFSIAGLIVVGSQELQRALIDLISTAVPGLIDAPGQEGAIDPQTLLKAGVFGWTGAIALIGLVVTTLGWLASARDAVRVVFGLDSPKTNFVILKLKDLGLAVGFGLVLVVSAVLSVAGSAATGILLDAVGIGSDSVAATIAGRVVTLAIMFVLDALVLGMLFRVLSGVHIPWSRLRGGVLLGALGLGILKVLGTALLGGARSNPLLASFAIIIGLLIFFNFVCQVILLSASWIAVGMKDRGIPLERPRKVGAAQ
jgi:membrane protein